MSTARQPTPPVAPVTTTGPLSGVVPLRAAPRGERCGEAGGADRHRLERRERRGDRAPPRPTARARSAAQPPHARRAELVAGDEHARAGRPRGIRRSGDGAGGIDPRDVRVARRHLVLAGRGEGVLGVERGRSLDGDRDLAGRQRVEREFLHRAAGLAVGGPGDERAKRLSHGAGSSTRPGSSGECSGASSGASRGRVQRRKTSRLAGQRRSAG